MPINHEERAYLAWPILCTRAKSHSDITYGELASLLGIHHRAVRYVLGPIQEYCMEEGLPPLTALVLNKNTGMPGTGFIAREVDEIPHAFEEIYAQDWDSLPNPFGFASHGESSSDLLARTLLDDAGSADDIYAKVRVRGIAQMVFRRSLMAAYAARCAICGTTLQALLEAAHIIPWSESDRKHRIDPRNGLLLCATHHRLFDLGLMGIDTQGYIWCSTAINCRNERDRQATLALRGEAACLPQNESHRPYPHALESHRKKSRH